LRSGPVIGDRMTIRGLQEKTERGMEKKKEPREAALSILR